MDIRMYDCCFGDCFRVDSEDAHHNPILVDFGIHCNSMGRVEREARFRDIIADMPEHIDFLLTHYHADHYNGIIYMMRNYPNLRFENVFIPDVWNINQAVDYIGLLLLKGLLTKSYIKNRVTIFSFLIGIIRKRSIIHFVKEGSRINNQYTVLWPDFRKIDLPKINGTDVGLEFDGALRVSWETVRGIALSLVRLMQEISRGDRIVYEVSRDYIYELERLENAYIALVDDIEANGYLQYKLSSWGNNISIVFHSTDNVNRKILFTGDVGQKYWPDIIWNQNMDTSANYYNGPCLLYDVIKVPHHGTAGYYYNFNYMSDSNTKLLIPNGNHRGWRICDAYSYTVNAVDGAAICSNCNSCEANGGGVCVCRKHKIVNHAGFYCDV